MPLGALYRPLLELAREARVDVDHVLCCAGLTESQLLDPSMRLSPDRSRALAGEFIARIGAPEIGLRAAERLRLSDIGLLGNLIRHAAHPLAALERIARYA